MLCVVGVVEVNGFYNKKAEEKIANSNLYSGGFRNSRRGCSSTECEYQFCIKCILRVVAVGEEVGNDWKCFVCVPESLYALRAQHWALVNYEAKQKTLNMKK